MQMFCRGLFMLAAMLLVSPSWAQQHSFLQFVPGDEDWQGSLQTSVSRYENAAGQVVDLVAAIHIADASYYEALNSYFDSLDLVLYELVTDDEAQIRSSGTRANMSAIGILQSSVAGFLDLQFQLNGIDYQKGHFIRADLSAQQLAQIMASKDESFFSMFLKMAMAQMAAEQQAIANQDIQPSTLTIMTLISALSAENQAQALKYLLAQELGRSGDLALSPEQESGITILGDRNAVALKSLRESLARGTRSTGLFYGAAHMPGIERELVEELGFRRLSREWYTAWEIP